MVAALFGVLTLIAGIWSAVTYQRVYSAAIEFLPPQFQDDTTSRYAFPVWALRHPMPLALQAEYVRVAKGSCVFALCGALTLLSASQVVLGCLALAAFFLVVFEAIKASRIYAQNCDRARAQESEHYE